MTPAFEMPELVLWMLASVRATGLLLILPFFLVRSIPAKLRVAFAGLLAFMVMPASAAGLAMPSHAVELVLLMARELAIGLLMGFSVRVIFYIVDFAAQILSVEIGLNPSPGLDPTINTAGSPVGTGLFYLAVVIFFGGAHYFVLFAFARSFELVPPGFAAPANVSLATEVLRHTAGVFELGLLMAAPILAVNFLINLTFSVLGRVVPKMNVFILSFSARIAAGMAMLALSAGLIVHYLTQQLGHAPELMLRFLPFVRS